LPPAAEDDRAPAIEHRFSFVGDGWNPAPPQLLVERGADPTTLLIGLRGFGRANAPSSFDFLSTSGALRYSRILLNDSSHTCYLAGIPTVADSMDSLAAVLRQHVTDLAPQRVMVVGPSAAAFAAIVLGHLIAADFVHAFSPYTDLTPATLAATGDRERFATVHARLEKLPATAQRFLDLRALLGEWNGKTRYNVHYCEYSAVDVTRCTHLAGLPGVVMRPHACDRHGVTRWLAGKGQLLPILQMENQLPAAQDAEAGQA
jgi:hypothetical protein